MTQYLILHKVRGEPAFDIAEQIQIGDEEGWIIPTSGHRAYPHQIWPLPPECEEAAFNTRLPADWPDHYEYNDNPTDKGMGLPVDIGKILGNLMPNFKRRI
jgi:hypothetical protein